MNVPIANIHGVSTIKEEEEKKENNVHIFWSSRIVIIVYIYDSSKNGVTNE